MGQPTNLTTAQKLPPGVEVLPPDKPEDKLEGEAAFPWLKMAILFLLMLLYTGSPIDLIPDFIPILGQVDDLLVDFGLFGLMVRALLRWWWIRRALARGENVKTVVAKTAGRGFFSWLIGRR